jgi:cytochrome c-type biogenesis protein CcmF
MEETVYVGEQVLPGILGSSLVIVSFVASILAMVGYYLAAKKNDSSWLKFGRWSFRAHTIAVFAIIGVLFYILFNHLYEYDYAWKHLSNDLPGRYIFSCFWEGQEGSFLLWTIWHVVLGSILIWRSGSWEPWVMAVLALVEVFLTSMLLGVYIGDFQIGQNPFLLLRETEAQLGMPWTRSAEYLTLYKQFQDGMGLNPLLQNYWMTIHPPTLFLGFASVVVPFVYAIAGLWRRDYTGWIKPAIPWAFFAVAILGLGILMGGAWAYEALGFGGFWAWDPVENSSLVPWLVLIGGAHLLVVNNRKPTSLYTTFLLIIGSFILILYSTFLTRSGVLGDTSVHAFVESGILPQLTVFLCFFVVLFVALMQGKTRGTLWYLATIVASVILTLISGLTAGVVLFLISSIGFLVVSYFKVIPRPKKEENLWSREFWMFLGAVLFIFSAVQIIVQTSMPLLNELIIFFGGEGNYQPPSDVFPVYHRWQIPFAIIILILAGSGQFLKYGNTDYRKFGRKMLVSLIISIALTFIYIFAVDFEYYNYQVHVLLGAAIFAIVANAEFLFRVLKGKLDYAGASLAHIGFALLMVGALMSTSQQEIISENQLGDITKMSADFDNRKDMAMYQNDTLLMGDYFVSYRGREKSENGFHLDCYVDYFGKVEKTYSEGDLIWIKNGMFMCMTEHVANEGFLEDFDNWSEVPFPNPRQIRDAETWVNGDPGEFLFTLTPSLIFNKQKGNSREPSIRHYLGHDVYTYLKYVNSDEPVIDEEGYHQGKQHIVKKGDRVLVSNIMVSVDSLVAVTDYEKHRLLEKDRAAKLVLTLDNGISDTIAEPLFIVRDSLIVPDMEELPDWGMKFAISKIDPHSEEITLSIWEHERIKKDFIVMQAVIFPHINVLWLGCIIMVLGSVLAIRHRVRINRKQLDS